VTPVVPGGISCRELVELVTAYLDGVLEPEVVQRIDAHLKLCAPCVEYVEQVRTTARLASAATAELQLRPDRDALLAAFREFKSDS
jgi:predicted anti-sigma-YlaC factor YlaD